MHEPEWIGVVGGPPPGWVLFRDWAAAIFTFMVALLTGLALPLDSRLLILLIASGMATTTFVALRQSWRRAQQIRVFGNILEHRDGQRVVRVVLNRAVLSAAVAPPGMLILRLDDGRGQVTVARRADPHEVLNLPLCMRSYLELRTEDFEQIRQAAQRSYPQA